MERYHWAREDYLSARVKSASLQLRHHLDVRAGQIAAGGSRVYDFSDETNMGAEQEPVKQAVIDMVKKGLPVGELRGLSSFRQVIAEKEKEEKGLDLDPDKNIMVTSGGSMQSMYFAMQATIDPGDEVIFGYPGLTVDEIAKLAGGKPVYVPIRHETGYRYDLEALERAITPKTKMIYFNSPNNPTGRVFPRDEVQQIADIAIDHDLLVLSDEVHETNVWDGRKHVSIATLPGMQDRTIVCNSITKCYHMFRWRVGWMLANEHLIDQVDKLMMWSAQFPPPLMQAGAEALLRGIRGELKDWYRETQADLQLRRDTLWGWLSSMPGFVPFKPEGTFLSFSDTSSLDRSSVKLAEYLLEEAHVLVAPGISYLGEGHLRISFDRPRDEINEGMERAKAALEEYPGPARGA
jgi:aspartate/methionine/tyrosine aminotransferase